jgi:hypothetical protein
VYFDLDTVVLDAAQAVCVALPAAGIPALSCGCGAVMPTALVYGGAFTSDRD